MMQRRVGTGFFCNEWGKGIQPEKNGYRETVCFNFLLAMVQNKTEIASYS